MINTDDIDFGDLSSSIANPEISDEGLVKLKELLDDMQQDLTYCFDAANTNNAVDNMYIAIEHPSVLIPVNIIFVKSSQLH